jgi:hypothetical protein
VFQNDEGDLGHLEMCWHLSVWDKQVEVLALRDMAPAWRRPDFL